MRGGWSTEDLPPLKGPSPRTFEVNLPGLGSGVAVPKEP
jgi:hypothetical protein